MKKFLTKLSGAIILVVLLSGSNYAQNGGQFNLSPVDKNCPDMPLIYQGRQVMTSCESMPTYIDGADARNEYFSDSANWPAISRKEKFQEVIYAKFVLDTNGKTCYVCIMNRLFPDKFTDIEKEVIRLLENMPAWNPGVNNGIKVPVVFNIPIRPNITEYK
jgi:hypothetical protein